MSACDPSPTYTVCPATTRIDITTNAGDPFDLLLPLLDDNDDPVEIVAGAEASWLVHAQVRRNVYAATVLHEWTSTGATPNATVIPGEAAQVRLTATPAETAAWQTTWPDFTCVWDADVTEPSTGPGDPDGGPTPSRIAAGRFRLLPEITR